jgi:hypothetical protein
MPAKIKVNGTWKTFGIADVKVNGQWKVTSAAFIKVGGKWKKFLQGSLRDLFARTASSLGTSDSGAVWTAVNGTWFTNGSAAQSDDSASNYSLATLPLGSTSGTVAANVSPGTGVSWWVSSAGSWWASYATVTTTSTGGSTCNNGACSGSENYACYQGYSTCDNGACSGTYTVPTQYGTCQSSQTPTTTGAGSYSDSNFNGNSAACAALQSSVGTNCTYYFNGFAGRCSINCAGTTTNVTTWNYNGCSYNGQVVAIGGGGVQNCSCGSYATTCSRSCSCSYSSSSTYALNIVSSVSGSVTSQASVALSAQAAALSAVVTPSSITVTAYSDSVGGTSVGTATTTPSFPITTGSYGIIKAPSTSSQGSTVSNFSAHP